MRLNHKMEKVESAESELTSLATKLTLPVVTVGAGTIAQNYFAAACYFFLGVKALSKGSSDLAPACASLAAQALECALKAYLSKSGVTQAALKKKPFCHNLEALWADAFSQGLTVSAQPPEWCVILNQTHDKPYYLRYPIGINGFQTPDPAPMVSELKRLLDLIEVVV
jgi:hypothetical protein